MVRREEDRQDPTLQQVARRLAQVRVRVCNDPGAQAFLYKAMGIGDRRLPFVLSIDGRDRGVFAGANYSIRMARTLLLTQELISGGT